MSEEREGWGWPGSSRKAHYFKGSTSICGKWMYTGLLEQSQGGSSPDDCVVCTRKRAAVEADR